MITGNPKFKELLSSLLTKEESSVIENVKKISTVTMKTVQPATAVAQSIPWYQLRNNLMKELTEEDFKRIYRSKVLLKFFDLLFENSYITTNLYKQLFDKYPHLAKDILKNSVEGSLLIYLIELGYHQGIESINKLSLSDNFEFRLYSVSRCSFATLKKLRKDPNKKVRLESYKRLGPDEYLDEMLIDKNMEIRLIGARFAPMYYHKFKEMKDELSMKVFCEVAKKIDTKQIPYIMGNRNMKSPLVKSILDRRLMAGNIDFNEQKE